MKITTSFPLLGLLLVLSSQLSYAAEPSLAIEAPLDALEAPRAVYYAYDLATKQEIADHAAKLFANLNRYANAGLDMNLLAGGEKGERFRVVAQDKQFYALGPASLGFAYARDMTSYLRAADAQAGMARRLPDAAQAVKLAQEYLSKLELLPSNMSEVYVTKVNVIRTAACGHAQCGSQATDRMRVVFFGRKLNGLPVHGASRMVVRIGNDGELVGVIKNWPNVTPVALDPAAGLLDRAQWKDSAVRTVKRIESGRGTSSVAIDSTEVILYDDGRGTIEPALRAKGRKVDARGAVSPGTWTIPIAARPKARYADPMYGGNRSGPADPGNATTE